eukprot:gene26452-15335_t
MVLGSDACDTRGGVRATTARGAEGARWRPTPPQPLVRRIMIVQRSGGGGSSAGG